MLNVTSFVQNVQSVIENLLTADPSDMRRMEQAVRDRFLALAGQAMEMVYGRYGKGYEGASRTCDCGGTARYVGDRVREVQTLCGPIALKRAWYHCPTCRHGRAPLERALKIDHRWSPGIREMVALAGVGLPYERAADMIRRLSGVAVSSTSTEKLTEAAGRRAIGAMAEARHAAPKVLPKKGPFYVMMDGVMTPLRGRWAETKLGVITHKNGLRRYVAHLGGPEPLGRMLRRTAAAMGIKKTQEVVVVGDGARWIWNQARDNFPGARQIVDWYHASQHIGDAARQVFGEGAPRGHTWTSRLRDLLWKEGGQAVLESLKRSKYMSRQPVLQLIEYIHNNVSRMNYPLYRRLGLDVGSGPVESGCKQVVQARLKGAGMRWTESDAQCVTALRCLYLSDQWDAFWKHEAA
ncbi:MAG: ISKra4 family transposase [Lysobacterales bacterium]|nr:MAG: ISKra4 family transposase [Xanthomonadales bacterium]